MVELNDKSRPRKKENKEKKEMLLREKILFLTPKQILQRIPIALAQVKAGNTSENLINEIRQIIYSLYRAKEVTKKV